MIGINPRLIEPAFLNAEVSSERLSEFLSKLSHTQFSGISVPSFWVKKTVRDLGERDIPVFALVGFPLGFQHSSVKFQETRQAISDGALGIHMVWSQTSYLSGMNWPKIEIAQMAKECHANGCFLSVMISWDWVDSENAVEIAKIVQDGGADYLTLGTNFSEEPDLTIIEMIRKESGSQLGIKTLVSGSNEDQLVQIRNAGVDGIISPAESSPFTY